MASILGSEAIAFRGVRSDPRSVVSSFISIFSRTVHQDISLLKVKQLQFVGAWSDGSETPIADHCGSLASLAGSTP